MPGLAKTDKFLLSTATVMIGAMADLHSLNPAAHSIGLVKNFQLSLDPEYTELTQGLTNSVVMSVRTNEPVRASMEVYEYTLRNLAYASGLDGSGAAYDTLAGLALSTASITAAATAIVVTGDVTADYVAGTYAFLQGNTDSLSDQVHIVKVSSSAYSAPNTTINFVGYAIPTGVTFPVGTRVGLIKKIPLATGVLFQPELAAKVVGILPKNNEPFTILFPKVKITNGLNVSFDSGQFTNLPFEFTPYAGVSTDPFYSEYGAASAVLFPR
jgi:hypothetical protein